MNRINNVVSTGDAMTITMPLREKQTSNSRRFLMQRHDENLWRISRDIAQNLGCFTQYTKITSVLTEYQEFPRKGHSEQSQATDTFSVSKPETKVVDHIESDSVKLSCKITIQIKQVDGGYIATYPDANIASGGVDKLEAEACLKSLIADLYLSYENNPDHKLGPMPKRQYDVLKKVLTTR